MKSIIFSPWPFKLLSLRKIKWQQNVKQWYFHSQKFQSAKILQAVKMYLKLEMVIKRWIYIQIKIFKKFLAPESILYKSSKTNSKLTYKIKKLKISYGRGKPSRIRVRYGSEPLGVVSRDFCYTNVKKLWKSERKVPS